VRMVELGSMRLSFALVMVVATLLLQAGDVEVNPGPTKNTKQSRLSMCVCVCVCVCVLCMCVCVCVSSILHLFTLSDIRQKGKGNGEVRALEQRDKCWYSKIL